MGSLVRLEPGAEVTLTETWELYLGLGEEYNPVVIRELLSEYSLGMVQHYYL
jgi:hypothetical protein